MTPELVYNEPAVISECGLYRYSLMRKISPLTVLPVLFIMLNPSVADARLNDPTIRRCINYGIMWGFGRLIVANLFAYRATNPRELSRADDPVGPENASALASTAAAVIDREGLIVCAWGARGSLMGRGQYILQEMSKVHKLHTLGLTKSGEPKHPLYLPGDLYPVEWREAA